jgi:hypothetical protein
LVVLSVVTRGVLVTMGFDWKRNILLCDWTEYQGPLDPKRVEGEGFAGVFLKASGRSKRGTTAPTGFYEDPLFRANGLAMGSSSMLRGAYHYLVPGFTAAQAGILYDHLTAVGGPSGWMAEVDAEEAGLTASDVLAFCDHWLDLTNGYPLTVYTRRGLWAEWGNRPFLHSDIHVHLARYVSAEIRQDSEKPYASQHARGIDVGWMAPLVDHPVDLLQFTDNALVSGKRTTASMAPWTREQLQGKLIR